MSEQKNDTLDNLDYSIGNLDLDDLTADKPADISDLDALFAEDQNTPQKAADPTQNSGIDADFLSQLDDMSDLGTLNNQSEKPVDLSKDQTSDFDEFMNALDDIPVANSDSQKTISTFEEENPPTQNIPDPAVLAGAAAATAAVAAKSEKPQGFFAKLFGKKDKGVSDSKTKAKPLFGNKKASSETQHKSRLGKLKATAGIGKPKAADTTLEEPQEPSNLSNDTIGAPETKQSKGFFSGRFGKKEKPITGTTFDTQEKMPGNGFGDVPDELINASSKPAKESKFKAFGATKNNKASKTKLTSGAKSSNGNKKSNALLIAGLACALAIAGAGYVFLMGDNSATNTPAANTASVAPPPAQEQQPVDPSLQGVPADGQNPDAMANNPSAPTTQDNAAMPGANPNAGQGVNPDEILNAQVPSDPALVKEEIDRLSDTNSRLKEQGKIAEDQLQVMEKLTTAKAEQIALLEKQIAELEKQKNNVAIPSQGANNPPPAQPAQ